MTAKLRVVMDRNLPDFSHIDAAKLMSNAGVLLRFTPVEGDLAEWYPDDVDPAAEVRWSAVRSTYEVRLPGRPWLEVPLLLDPWLVEAASD